MLNSFPQHVILGITAIAVMLGIMSFTPNRLIRRRLRLSIVLLVGYLAVDATLRLYGARFSTDTQGELTAFDKLALAAALINAAVFVLINPLRADRVPRLGQLSSGRGRPPTLGAARRYIMFAMSSISFALSSVTMTTRLPVATYTARTLIPASAT